MFAMSIRYGAEFVPSAVCRNGYRVRWHRSVTSGRETHCDSPTEDVCIFRRVEWVQTYYDDFGGRPGSLRGRETVLGYIVDGVFMDAVHAMNYMAELGLGAEYLKQLRRVQVI